MDVRDAQLIPGHDDKGNITSQWDIPTLAGGGAIRSSIADMLKYAIAQMEEKIFSKGRH